MVKPIQSLQEFQQLINGDKTIVIDFWATWCGPCNMISPTFEELADDRKENPNIEFYKVDIDEQEDITMEVQIKSMPTFMVFQGGSKVGELVGANPVGLTNLVANFTPA